MTKPTKIQLPKSDIEILNQLIDDERGVYRIRIGRKVHYLRIFSSVFNEDTMCRPYLLIPQLPDLPEIPWTTMVVSRDEDGSLKSVMSTDPLPEIRTTWHESRIDVLDLERTEWFRSAVHEVWYNGAPAVAKIACFEWDVSRIERETWAYAIMARHRGENPDEPPIAPDFLGHLTENGRVMGILLQKIDGNRAAIDDLADCNTLLRRLHSLGIVHGDVNRHNFVVDRAHGNGIRLIDFEHVEEFNERLAREELLSLPAELSEETGRGASVST